MRIALVPTEGGPSVELGRDLTLVGRSEEADLKLDHKSVSKLHCVLVRTSQGLMVRDLGSTNGTRINGQRVRRGALLNEDLLNLAYFTFRVELGEPKAPQNNQDLDNNATFLGNYKADNDASILDHNPVVPPPQGVPVGGMALSNYDRPNRNPHVASPAIQSSSPSAPRPGSSSGLAKIAPPPRKNRDSGGSLDSNENGGQSPSISSMNALPDRYDI